MCLLFKIKLFWCLWYWSLASWVHSSKLLSYLRRVDVNNQCMFHFSQAWQTVGHKSWWVLNNPNKEVPENWFHSSGCRIFSARNVSWPQPIFSGQEYHSQRSLCTQGHESPLNSIHVHWSMIHDSLHIYDHKSLWLIVMVTNANTSFGCYASVLFIRLGKPSVSWTEEVTWMNDDVSPTKNTLSKWTELNVYISLK